MSRGALVLAGGNSTRMGRDKAMLAFDGRLLLVRVAMRMRLVPGVDEIVVACGPAERREPYAKALAALHDVETRVVADEADGLGPLAGLAAGLANARADYVALSPVDAPWIAPPLIAHLFERAEAERADGAVVEREGRLEALWGVYRRRTTAGHFRYALARGVRAAHEALAGLDLAIVDEDEARALDPDGTHFRDVDVPGDLPGHRNDQTPAGL